MKSVIFDSQKRIFEEPDEDYVSYLNGEEFQPPYQMESATFDDRNRNPSFTDLMNSQQMPFD